jgi:hypothetical protein
MSDQPVADAVTNTTQKKTQAIKSIPSTKFEPVTPTIERPAQHKTNTRNQIHTLNEIRTCDPSNRAASTTQNKHKKSNQYHQRNSNP